MWTEVRPCAVRGNPVGRDWPEWLTGETLVCRCAEVTYRALGEAVVDRGVRDLRALRLRCGVGLGACQGRICERNIAELAGNLLGQPRSEPRVEPAAFDFAAKDCG